LLLAGNLRSNENVLTQLRENIWLCLKSAMLLERYPDVLNTTIPSILQFLHNVLIQQPIHITIIQRLKVPPLIQVPICIVLLGDRRQEDQVFGQTCGHLPDNLRKHTQAKAS